VQVVGLIPARGGSKGIPRKNLAPLAGKPLLAWTIEAAQASPSLSRVVVSTDDEEIADVAHALVLLQPTSPLRRPDDIEAALGVLRDTGASAVVSVVGVPHRYAPTSLMELDGDRLVVRDGPLDRQLKTVLYARNGPAILALRTATLGGELYAGDVRAYVMGERESLDIDTPFDLELAEAILA
jgi:CMP-N-acetylneuraminic acid synthetase